MNIEWEGGEIRDAISRQFFFQVYAKHLKKRIFRHKILCDIQKVDKHSRQAYNYCLNGEGVSDGWTEK